jgi:hypothetical protein
LVIVLAVALAACEGKEEPVSVEEQINTIVEDSFGEGSVLDIQQNEDVGFLLVDVNDSDVTLEWEYVEGIYKSLKAFSEITDLDDLKIQYNVRAPLVNKSTGEEEVISVIKATFTPEARAAIDWEDNNFSRLNIPSAADEWFTHEAIRSALEEQGIKG